MVILDANMVLRYLLNDNAEMADTADSIIRRGNASVTIEVIAEVVYVLKGVYGLTRTRISDVLLRFLPLVSSTDDSILSCALKTYGTENLDFVDCVLYAYHQIDGAQIATFDKKLLALINR